MLELKQNVKKLISPYDVHIFLHQILNLSAPKTPLTAKGCPKCVGLFDKIPSSRSCSEAKISQESCPCMPDPMNSKDKIGRHAVSYALNEINNNCSNKMQLKSIEDVKIFHYDSWNLIYHVRFHTTNSKNVHELQLRREPFSLFTPPNFEILAYNNINEPLCDELRDKIMSRIVQHLFHDFNYANFSEK